MSSISSNDLNNRGKSGVQQSQNTNKIQRTKGEINKVVISILSIVPHDAAAIREINQIANELYKYADEHNGAVGQEGFTKLLKKLTPENVIGVIMKYNNQVSPDESIVEMMLDEVTSNKSDIKEALIGQGEGKNKLRGLFTVLLDRAKEVGMDDKTIQSYRNQFEKELNKELSGMPYFRSSEELDKIINVVIQSIKNLIDAANQNSKEATQTIEPANKQQTRATNTIVRRYNKASNDFNQQLKTDGWAEDVADAMGRLWGKNYADAVRKDLKVAKKDIDRLKAALEKGDEAFRAEFLNIFKITYNPVNISAFERAEEAYIIASNAKNNEENFKTAFASLLNNKPLRAEYSTQSSPTTGGSYQIMTASETDVYNREFKKVAELFDSVVKNDKSGQFALLGITDGKSYVEKAIETAGAKDKSVDEKYKILQNIVNEIQKSLTAETQKACGGRSFDAIKTQYENCYKAAYGLENDILKRVTDYNVSQQRGGGAVKGAVVAAAAIGIGFLTAGTGTAAVAGGTGAAVAGGASATTAAVGALKGAATVAALTAGVEISDRFTSKEALDALRNDGVLAFLEKGAEVTDWKQVATASLVSGAMCVAFAGQSYAITNLTMKVARAAGIGTEAAGYTAASLSTIGFVATGLGTEYLFQGEISVEGATFTVIMALVSGGMQVRQVYKTAQVAKEQIQAQKIEDVVNARKALGFADDEVINLDKAEKAYKEIARKHHPNSSARTGDGAMHDAIFAAAQNAIDVLRKNATLINARVTPKTNVTPSKPEVKQITAKPEVGNTNPSGETALIPIAAPEATVVPINPAQSVGAIAAAESGPVAEASKVPVETTGKQAYTKPEISYLSIDSETPLLNTTFNEATGFDVMKAISDAEASIAGEPAIKNYGRGNTSTTYYDASGREVKNVMHFENGRTEVTYTGNKSRPDIVQYNDGHGVPYGYSVGNLGSTPVTADGNGNIISINELNDLNLKAARAEATEVFVRHSDIKANLTKALEGKAYKDKVLPMLEKYPEIIQILDNAKATDGTRLLSDEDINYILFCCEDRLATVPERIQTIIKAVVDNPQEVANIESCNGRGIGLYYAISDPMPSTRENIPALMPVEDGQVVAVEDADAVEITENENLNKSLLEDLYFPVAQHKDITLEEMRAKISELPEGEIKDSALRLSDSALIEIEGFGNSLRNNIFKMADEYLKLLDVIGQIKDPICASEIEAYRIQIVTDDFLAPGEKAQKFEHLRKYAVRVGLTETQAFMQGLKEKRPDVYTELQKNPQDIEKPEIRELKEDYLKHQKYEATIAEIHLKVGTIESDEIYERYLEDEVFSENKDTDKHLKDLCRQINKDFHVKVFLPSNLKEAGVALKYVYAQLARYQMHAGNEVLMFPVTLDFYSSHATFIPTGVNGLCRNRNGSISVKGLTIRNVSSTLAHELMHANDFMGLEEFPKGVQPRDYRQEFLNAGLSEDAAMYACTNPKEFIAVAAEGDLTKYSENMKNLLITLGMPEWMLTMPQVISHDELQYTKMINSLIREIEEESDILDDLEIDETNIEFLEEDANLSKRSETQKRIERIRARLIEAQEKPEIVTIEKIAEDVGLKPYIVAYLINNESTGLRKDYDPVKIERHGGRKKSTEKQTPIKEDSNKTVVKQETELKDDYSRLKSVLEHEQVSNEPRFSDEEITEVLAEISKNPENIKDILTELYTIKTPYGDVIDATAYMRAISSTLTEKPESVTPAPESAMVIARHILDKDGNPFYTDDDILLIEKVQKRMPRFTKLLLQQQSPDGNPRFTATQIENITGYYENHSEFVIDIVNSDYSGECIDAIINTYKSENQAKIEFLENLLERNDVESKVIVEELAKFDKNAQAKDNTNSSSKSATEGTKKTDDETIAPVEQKEGTTSAESIQAPAIEENPAEGTPTISPEEKTRIENVRTLLKKPYVNNEVSSIKQIAKQVGASEEWVRKIIADESNNLLKMYLTPINFKYRQNPAKIKAVYEQMKNDNENFSIKEFARKLGKNPEQLINYVTPDIAEICELQGLFDAIKAELKTTIRTYLEEAYSNGELVQYNQLAQKLGYNVDTVRAIIENASYGLNKIFISGQEFFTKEFANKIKNVLNEVANNQEKITLEQLAEKLDIDVCKLSFFMHPKNAKFFIDNGLWEQVKATVPQGNEGDGISETSKAEATRTTETASDTMPRITEAEEQEYANAIRTILEEAIKNEEKYPIYQIVIKLKKNNIKLTRSMVIKFVTESNDKYGLRNLWEKVRPAEDSSETDNLSLLETHYNSKRLNILKEAETTQKEVFEQAKIKIQELIETVQPGTRMDERLNIDVGNNTISIFVDKTREGNTNVTVKNYLGKVSEDNHAPIESTMHFRIDDNGELQYARIDYEDYFPEDDIMRYTYRYIKQSDGQYIIDSRKTYYPDVTYLRNKNPLWERQEQYTPTSDDLTTWECSSHDGSRAVEGDLEYNPDESGIKNMFLELLTERTKGKAGKSTNSGNTEVKHTSKETQLEEAPKPETTTGNDEINPLEQGKAKKARKTTSPKKSTSDSDTSEYEFKKPDPDESLSWLREEATGTEDELFEKGRNLLTNLLENLADDATVTEPKIITVGNNHFGFTIENTPEGNRLVTIKNWLGDKESWDVSAVVEDGFRFEIDGTGKMIRGKFFSGNNSSKDYSYTFERRDGGNVITYQEDHFAYPSLYRNSAVPTSSYSREFVQSNVDSDNWVAKDDSMDGFDGKNWRFAETEDNLELSTFEFGPDLFETNLMNMFLEYANADRIGSLPSRTAIKPEETVSTETPQEEAVDNSQTPHSSRKPVPAEKAKAALDAVRDKIDIAQIQKHIIPTIYKRAVMNPYSLDQTIELYINQMISNANALLPQTKAFLADIIKDIVQERVKDVKKPDSNVMKDIDEQLDAEFSDIIELVDVKQPLQVKNLFATTEIMEILKAQGLNSGEIASLINTTTTTMRDISTQTGVKIDGRQKAHTVEQKTETPGTTSGTEVPVSGGAAKTEGATGIAETGKPQKAEGAKETDSASKTEGTEEVKEDKPINPDLKADQYLERARLAKLKTECKILEYCSQHNTVVKIAQRLEMKPEEVIAYLRELGIFDNPENLKPLDEEKILDYYKAYKNMRDFSLEDVAKHCGCSKQDADLILRKNGLAKQKKFPDQTKASEIASIIRRDYSTPVHQIAQKIGESDIYVLQRIAEKGLSTKTQLLRSALAFFDVKNEISSFYKFGYEISAIQKIFKYSYEQVKEILEENNLLNAKSKLKDENNYEKILECKKEGYNADEIAQITSEDAKVVREVLHENSGEIEVKPEITEEISEREEELLDEETQAGIIQNLQEDFINKMSRQEKDEHKIVLLSFYKITMKLKNGEITIKDAYESDGVQNVLKLLEKVKDNANKHINDIVERFNMFPQECSKAVKETGIDISAILGKYTPETVDSECISDAEHIIEIFNKHGDNYAKALEEISDWDISKEYPWLEAEANKYAMVKQKDGEYKINEAKRKEYFQYAKLHAGTITDSSIQSYVDIINNENISDELAVKQIAQIKNNPANQQIFQNWISKIKNNNVNLTFDEYYTLLKDYQILDEQIFYNGKNILDVFGVKNYDELVEFIDSNASTGGRTTVQTIFKMFGQKNIEGLKNYFDSNNIKSFSTRNIKSMFGYSIEFDNRAKTLTKNLNEIRSIIERVCGPIDLPHKMSTLIPNNIIKELVDNNEYIRSYYQGYPNILSYLGVNHTSSSNLEYDLRQVQINNPQKYNDLLNTMNNPRIASSFSDIHARMRFIERVLLKNGVDISDPVKVDEFTESFLNDLNDAFNQGVSVDQYVADNGRVSITVVVEMKNGKNYKIALDKTGLIHTIY